jgi:hypothetical protein
MRRDEARLVGEHNRLRAITQAQFREDARDLLGLLLTFVALWRARLIHVAYLGVFLLGAVLLSFAGGNPIAMLGSFAVLAAATSQITRVLLRPAGLPGEVVLPEHDHVAA